MKVYKLNVERFLAYMKENFNIDYIAFDLINEITQYLKRGEVSLESFYYKGEEIYVEEYMYILITILRNSRLNVTFNELLDNNIIMEVK